MYLLQKSAVEGECEMPTLRERLNKPGLYLLILASLMVCAFADARRAPKDQWTARQYISLVRAYQHWGRPFSAKFIRCRFKPTCSEYSILSVQDHGIATGLTMTVDRLLACR